VECSSLSRTNFSNLELNKLQIGYLLLLNKKLKIAVKTKLWFVKGKVHGWNMFNLKTKFIGLLMMKLDYGGSLMILAFLKINKNFYYRQIPVRELTTHC
jgi:hypothetical protein